MANDNITRIEVTNLFDDAREHSAENVQYENKVQSLALKDFMLFSDTHMEFSPYINVLCGANSTGKTAVLKTIYAVLKSDGSMESALVGAFCPENGEVDHLILRHSASAKIELGMSSGVSLAAVINHEGENHVASYGFDELHLGHTVFIPAKEIISVSNFAALYSKFHIDFEETYYDLAMLLALPYQRNLGSEQRQVVEKLTSLIGGTVAQRNGRFYLELNDEPMEMGLVSEGYRKIAALVALIMNGSLTRGSILFWDEPETGLNPKMIYPLVEAIASLARLGVQVFIATHDYFILQYLNMKKQFEEKEQPYRFISLYKDDDGTKIEMADKLSELTHNAVMEEFDEIYDKELRHLDRC